LRPVALDELGGRPHVMVDGAARPGSVLTLSHWPGTPTPEPLWRDLSAEIAFAYLASPEHWCDAELVTVDHLDADGLVALLALVDPPAARRRAELLTSVARAGDFELIDRRHAARVAFALRSLCEPPEPAGSPGRAPGAGERSWLAARAGELLELLPALCDRPQDWSAHYGEEEDAWVASERAFADGVATLEELGEAHLAVVRLPVGQPAAWGRVGPAAGTRIGLHPAAIHARSGMARVLVLEAERTTYYDRYETWVRTVSRKLPRRVDLQPLAGRLEAAERRGARWRADPPACTRPVLVCEGPSSIPEPELVWSFRDHLCSSPAAWDPFATPFSASLSAVAASRSGTSGRARARSEGRPSARP
jgi:hypothetical protein